MDVLPKSNHLINLRLFALLFQRLNDQRIFLLSARTFNNKIIFIILHFFRALQDFLRCEADHVFLHR